MPSGAGSSATSTTAPSSASSLSTICASQARVEADGDVETASLLAEATGDAQAALGELRDLAHGIHPAILTEAGLGPRSRRSPRRHRLRSRSTRRPESATPVETAAYQVVAEAIEDAATRGGTYAAVSAIRAGDQLVVEVEDDGSRRTSTLVHLADRVGAAGGTLQVEPTTLRAEVPCA